VSIVYDAGVDPAKVLTAAQVTKQQGIETAMATLRAAFQADVVASGQTANDVIIGADGSIEIIRGAQAAHNGRVIQKKLALGEAIGAVLAS
jgi:hypothetical protein